MNKNNKEYSSLPINFARICKEIRENSCFTKQEMASHLRVTLRTYERYESGKVKPGGDVGFRLAGLYLTFVFNKKLKE